MKNYLLNENQKISNVKIQHQKEAYEAGQNFLKLLKPLGIDTFTTWQKIKDKLNEPFPNASLLFNIQSQGLEQTFNEAEKHYNKYNSSIMRFEAVTDEEIEQIKEDAKVYTVNDVQNEAFEVLDRVAADLSRLNGLGLNIHTEDIRNLHRLFEVDNRAKQTVAINQRNLKDYIPQLK